MRLEEQVTNLELSKKLKELGVKQNAYWTWYENAGEAFLLHNPEGMRGFEEKSFDAFTVAELGEMLPVSVWANEETWWLVQDKQKADKTLWNVMYKEFDSHAKLIMTWDESEADARAKMLIYLLEEGLCQV